MTAAVDTCPPVITVEGPSYPFGSYYYRVDGKTVATILATSSGAVHGWDSEARTGRWHRDVMRRTEWEVYGPWLGSPGRYFGNLSDAQARAQEIAESATRCSRSVRCGLCRLPKRHAGDCVNWWE